MVKFAKKLTATAIIVTMLVISGCSPRRGTGPLSETEPSAPEPEQSIVQEPSSGPEPSESAEPSAGGEEPAEEQADNMDLTGESTVPAMSMDYSQISSLDASLVEWGSGGPVDSKGRPNGATLYQQKYEKYDAYFILPESGNNIYLTFDEGYEYGMTPAILDTLKEKDVKAVFFLTDHFARSEAELVRRMIDEGHIIGNHSTKHKSFPSMPLSEAEKDISSLHEYVKDTFGYEMTLFRFPEGKFSEQTLALVQSLGYKSIFWSFAYVDYYVDNQPLTIDALNKIAGKAHPGALYLLHAVSRTNAEVLGEAIDTIRSKGYTFSKIDL